MLAQVLNSNHGLCARVLDARYQTQQYKEEQVRLFYETKRKVKQSQLVVRGESLKLRKIKYKRNYNKVLRVTNSLIDLVEVRSKPRTDLTRSGR